MMKPMQFIVGLGNPGAEYINTRHNVGAVVLERVASFFGDSPAIFHDQSRLSAQVMKVDQLVFAKSQTYMNESGKAVRAVLEYYDKSLQFVANADFPHLWVIHDDLDVEVGKYKIQFGTGPKGHNGLASIDEYLHSERYWHVRIGVDGREGARTQPGHEYVLNGFLKDEKELINQVIIDVSRDMVQRLQDTTFIAST